VPSAVAVVGAAVILIRFLRDSDALQFARLARALMLLPVPLAALRLPLALLVDAGVSAIDAVRRLVLLRTLAISPSPADSAGDGMSSAVSVWAGLAAGAGVKAVVGVAFTLEVPDVPFAKGGIRPEDNEIRDARDPGRIGDPCFRE
jgi:hypothetical protein